MSCTSVLNCPKGISRNELIKIATACGIPGHQNNYKSPYRNMNWLCIEIDKVAGIAMAPAPKTTKKISIKKLDKKDIVAPIKIKILPKAEKVNKANEKAKAKSNLTSEKREKIMKDYKKYWIREFGVDLEKPLFAQLGREKYIRAHGGVEGLQARERADFEEAMSEIIPERMAKKIQDKLRDGILCQPCSNLSPDEQAILFTVDPLRVIRLKVEKDGVSYCLCYDVQKLYEDLKAQYGTRDAEVAKWTDPTLGVKYSTNQIKRIKHIWSVSRPNSPARAHLETKLALSR